MSEILKGRAWVFGDDVDTDLIYHNKYLAETDPKNMPQYAFEYYPGKENFAKGVKPGDFVVAGKNFGCGSSREHAVYCIEYAGVPVVLAEPASALAEAYRAAARRLLEELAKRPRAPMSISATLV